MYRLTLTLLTLTALTAHAVRVCTPNPRGLKARQAQLPFWESLGLEECGSPEPTLQSSAPPAIPSCSDGTIRGYFAQYGTRYHGTAEECPMACVLINPCAAGQTKVATWLPEGDYVSCRCDCFSSESTAWVEDEEMRSCLPDPEKIFSTMLEEQNFAYGRLYGPDITKHFYGVLRGSEPDGTGVLQEGIDARDGCWATCSRQGTQGAAFADGSCWCEAGESFDPWPAGDGLLFTKGAITMPFAACKDNKLVRDVVGKEDQRQEGITTVGACASACLAAKERTGFYLREKACFCANSVSQGGTLYQVKSVGCTFK